MRKTHQWFCNSLIFRSRQSGRLDDNVLIESALDSFLNLERKTDEAERVAALRKAKRLLRRPDIKARVAEIYANRGFSLIDMVDMHIQHIRGIPMVLRTKEGEICYDEQGVPKVIYLDPNYQALRDMIKLVLPSTPQKVDLTLRRGGEYPPPVPDELQKVVPRAITTKIEDVS